MMHSPQDDISFKGNNPGAVKYGNFINYYQFHPPEERLRLLPDNIWTTMDFNSLNCLDVGCNAGDLTIALQKYLEKNTSMDTKLLGIDIDSILIKRAEETNPDRNGIQFKSMDIMDDDQRNIIDSYLDENDTKRFDIVFCFSVTMWIHLNHGDDGLKRFLKYTSDKCRALVVEAQPWKCYKTAVKRMKNENHSFPSFKGLKIRNDIESFVDNYLIDECGLEKIYETGYTNWGRKIVIYSKNKTD